MGIICYFLISAVLAFVSAILAKYACETHNSLYVYWAVYTGLLMVAVAIYMAAGIIIDAIKKK